MVRILPNAVLALTFIITTAVSQTFGDLSSCQQQCFAETQGLADGLNHCLGDRTCICRNGFESSFRSCAASKCGQDDFQIVASFASNFCGTGTTTSTTAAPTTLITAISTPSAAARL